MTARTGASGFSTRSRNPLTVAGGRSAAAGSSSLPATVPGCAAAVERKDDQRRAGNGAEHADGDRRPDHAPERQATWPESLATQGDVGSVGSDHYPRRHRRDRDRTAARYTRSARMRLRARALALRGDAFAAAVIAMCGAPRAGSRASARQTIAATIAIAGVVGGRSCARRTASARRSHTGDATVWVWTERALEPGQRVAVIGRLRTPRGALAPGAPIAQRSSRAEAPSGADRAPHRAARRGRRRERARVAVGRRGAARRGRSRVPGDDPRRARHCAASSPAIARRVPDELDQRWRAVGIYHVLSVSGLHLAVVAGLAFVLLRRLVAASPWGGRVRPARWAAPPALALAVAYTLVTGAQLATCARSSSSRSCSSATMLDRPFRLVDALGVAAIAHPRVAAAGSATTRRSSCRSSPR